LAAYVAAASASATVLSGEADAAVVGNGTVQPFGINQEVNIDFNGDGQVDFQIDHDRYNLNGTDIDYLQIDKNDINGASPGENILPMDGAVPFAVPEGVTQNDPWESAYANSTQGAYPLALNAGISVGPGTTFDFQEGDNYNGSGTTIRANRLIDEDMGQIDAALQPGEGLTAPTDGPNFLGLGGEVRYLGLRMALNAGPAGTGGPYNYGWIGIRIDNEADATGAVVGYAYESTPGTAIVTGDLGPTKPGDYNRNGRVDGEDFLVWQQQFGSTVPAGTGADGNNDTQVNALDYGIWTGAFGTASPVGTAVPEPASLASALVGGCVLCGAWLRKRLRRRSQA